MKHLVKKSNHIFKLRGYITYREDRPSHGGGVALCIKRSLNHHVLPKNNTDLIENVSVEMKINNIPTIFTSIYCPKHTTQFKNDIKKITPTHKNYIICGDFNARHRSWNCAKANTAGNVLFNMQLRSNFFIYNPSTPTRYPQSNIGRPSTIDIMLTNSPVHFSPLISLENVLQSDHCPVLFSINTSRDQRSERTILNFKKANWNLFQNRITELLHNTTNIDISNTTEDQIDQAINEFTDIINTAKLTIPVLVSKSFRIFPSYE